MIFWDCVTTIFLTYDVWHSIQQSINSTQGSQMLHSIVPTFRRSGVSTLGGPEVWGSKPRKSGGVKGWGSEGLRTRRHEPNVHISGSLEKQHQNSSDCRVKVREGLPRERKIDTRRPPPQREKKRAKMEDGRGEKKKREIFGSPTEGDLSKMGIEKRDAAEEICYDAPTFQRSDLPVFRLSDVRGHHAWSEVLIEVGVKKETKSCSDSFIINYHIWSILQ